MTIERIYEIANVLTGLKRHEWSKVACAVETAFREQSARLKLEDTAKISNLLQLDIFGKILTDDLDH